MTLSFPHWCLITYKSFAVGLHHENMASRVQTRLCTTHNAQPTTFETIHHYSSAVIDLRRCPLSDFKAVPLHRIFCAAAFYV